MNDTEWIAENLGRVGLVIEDGEIWRTGTRYGRYGDKKLRPCARHRVEQRCSVGYLRVRVCWDGNRFGALAHRVVWVYYNGAIPDGFQINHMNGIKADNRLVNLELVTQSQNIRHARDVLNVRFGQRGSEHANAKLCAADVRSIRERSAKGETGASIACDFPVQASTVRLVIRGKAWAHLLTPEFEA